MPLSNSRKDYSDKESLYLLTFALGIASLLELASVKEAADFEFEILESDYGGALIQCKRDTAISIIDRLGGSYKIVEVLGRGLTEALEKLPLPESSKFNWTISAYNCDEDLSDQTKEEVHSSLKSAGVGKSKFLQPQITTYSEVRLKAQPQRIASLELKVADLDSRVLSKAPDHDIGLDFVVHGGIRGTGPLFGHTVACSDVRGFDQRDFKRPYQDPTQTISPRLARVMVNLASGRGGMTLIDPFCGLGTILQEALLIGVSVIGTDKQISSVNKTRANLDWLTRYYHIPRDRVVSVFECDARRLDRVRLPRINAVATEPILLPVFIQNPKPAVASSAIRDVRETYEQSVRNFVNVLSEGGKIVITTPSIVDSAGRTHGFSLDSIAAETGLSFYHPSAVKYTFQYPLKLETIKRKTVLRNLNVMCIE